jgi:hypothetical protein
MMLTRQFQLVQMPLNNRSLFKIQIVQICKGQYDITTQHRCHYINYNQTICHVILIELNVLSSGLSVVK